MLSGLKSIMDISSALNGSAEFVNVTSKGTKKIKNMINYTGSLMNLSAVSVHERKGMNYNPVIKKLKYLAL